MPQIRIDDETFELLERIAERAAKPKSVCASLILEAFDQLLNNIDEDSTLFIENGSKRTQFALPFRPRRYKAKPSARNLASDGHTKTESPKEKKRDLRTQKRLDGTQE